MLSSDCLDPDLTPSCVIPFLAFTCKLLLTALVTQSLFNSQKCFGVSRVTFYPPLCQYVMPSPPKRDAFRYYFQLDLETLPFSSLFAPKTSKMLPFPDFFSKVPKMTKGTIWGNIWSNNHDLGLKWPPKSVTLFVSSNTLTLEICLSSSKCAFILIKIQARGHLTLI